MGGGRKPKKPHRWTGELAKPIRPKVVRPRGLAVTAETVQAANKEMEDLYRQAIEKEYLVKLDLLMDDYGITDKTNFFRLALALAHEHVPGFGLDLTLRLDGADDEGPWLVVQDNNRGRPSEWPEKRLDLLSAVEQAKKKHNLSTDHDALSQLARHGKWSRPAGQRPEQWLKTLKNQLAEARRFGRPCQAAEAGLLDAQLASLPSLDESRAEIVNLIQAPATKIARLLSAQRSHLSQDNPGN